MMRDTVDLVLVNAANRTRIYQALGQTLTAVENPVWAGLIATFVRHKGFSVAVVDAEAENLGPEEAAARVVDLRPRLVAIVVYGHQPSASTQNMTGASAVTTAIKNLSPQTKVLLLGGHVAALPARTLDEERCDFVASDEGLCACVDLLSAFGAAKDPDLAGVRGLVYRTSGGIASNLPDSPNASSRRS